MAIPVFAVGFAALLAMKFARPEMPWWALGAGLLVLFSFTSFSVYVDEFKLKHAVAVRMPMLLSSLSVITLLISLLLLPFSTVTNLDPKIFAMLFAYGIIVTGLPYLVYERIMLTEGLPLLLKTFVIGTMLTLGGQYLIFGEIHLISLSLIILIELSILASSRYFVYPVDTSEKDFGIHNPYYPLFVRRNEE